MEQKVPEPEEKTRIIRVLSFNIRYGTANDGENSWEHRKYLVSEIISRYDIIGLQEALKFQIDDILEDSHFFEMTGVGRDDGDTLGEYSAILYNSERFNLLTYSTLWLSDTPDTPGSMSWGNHIPRIITWAKFKDIYTGERFFVFNTHWDHESQDSRVKSARFLRETINDIAHYDNPVVITGDFNAVPESPEMQIITAQNKNDDDMTFRFSYIDINPEGDLHGTYHDFNGTRDGDKVDYVIVNRLIKTLEARVIHENDGGRYPSDHFPVMAEIMMK